VYGVYAVNSPGVALTRRFQIVPTGCWNFDGDFWLSSKDNFIKSAWYNVRVPKWFAPTAPPSVVTPANGFTPLTAPAQNAAWLLFNVHLNAIEL
jgi:hypothetical protein